MSEPQDLGQYRETSTVRTIEPNFVFLVRPCGEATFSHKNDVVEPYRSRWDLLVEGAPVYHGMRFSEEKQQWQAFAAELYSREELDEFFNPSPVEPEAIAEAELEPLVEPELVESVLASATRNKSLIQLILEGRRGKP